MGKQQEFEDVQISKMPDVVSAATFYCEARDEVTSSKERQKEAKQKLISAMDDHGIDDYERDGFVIHKTPGTPSIDVKRAKGD